MEFDLDNFKVQGIKMNYLFICKRKLWLFSKGIAMEKESDRVLQGSLIHQSSYQKFEDREILIDDILRIDILEDDFVGEVKISSKMIEADKMQLLYYLYYLKSMGIEKYGTLFYIKEKKKENLVLTDNLSNQIEQSLIEIKRIVSLDKPPQVQKLPYCKKCAYYELCFSGEDEN
ncbi:MAG: CRISPR-associated protein Cas4 [Candidatus Micrarchaeia archaeon]|nr:CRISPR-associated protein Cas4 [Candidatus Rehaiarchaeum fermentans]